MNLIDWPGLARNALWIAGLAVAFAAVSHAGWRASLRGDGLRRELGEPEVLIAVCAGLLFVTACLAWGADQVLQRALWVIASLAFFWHIVALLRQQRAK